jgi:hypothetical protein
VAGLIFIDTNKLLDFYRQGGKSAFGLVDILLSQRDRVILTEQVWVEFRKHRQKLMDELWHKVEVAKSSTDPLPAAFKEYKHSKFLQDDVIFDKAKDQIKREIEDLIWKPDEDPVYDRLMQLYRSESALQDFQKCMQPRGFAQTWAILLAKRGLSRLVTPSTGSGSSA